MLVPGLNTTSIDRVPSPTDWEVMYSMLSTPFTSCSIGVATVSDSTCAEAPGYTARIFTVGGAISGYSETGSARWTIAPAIVRMIDSTAAKIGRSMKKWDKRIAYSLAVLFCALISPGTGDTTAPGRTYGLARPS